MCSGGGGDGGGDSAVTTRAGEEAYNPTAPANQRGGEAQSYTAAMGTVGNFMGETRSDQDIENDRAVTEALERGEDKFVDAFGRTQNVANYSRDFSPPTPGSLMARAADPNIGVGDVLGMGVSSLVGGVPGMIAGQIVGRSFTSAFPSTSARMSTLGGGRGKAGTGQ